MKLKFEFKVVCGRSKFYPLDPLSIAYLSIMDRRKCLSAKDMIKILKLRREGVESEIVADGVILADSDLAQALTR